MATEGLGFRAQGFGYGSASEAIGARSSLKPRPELNPKVRTAPTLILVSALIYSIDIIQHSYQHSYMKISLSVFHSYYILISVFVVLSFEKQALKCQN